MGRSIALLGWLIASWLLPRAAYSYTSAQVGVDSNLLVVRGQVLFVQADGSLTVLDLATGTVLLRKTDERFHGVLRETPAGIVVSPYREFMLLDKTSYALLWRSDKVYDPQIVGNRLVSHDDRGLTSCRELATGRVLWSYDLPGGFDLAVEKGRVLVFRAADYDTETPTLALLDLKSGALIFRKTPGAGHHYVGVHFDGNRVYAIAGRARGKRAETPPERLVVWDTGGREVSSRELPPSVRESYDRWRGVTLDGRVFSPGYLSHPASQAYGPAFEDAPFYALGLPNIAIELRDASVSIEKRTDLGTPIEFERGRQRWRGCLPYLAGRGRISALALSGGKLLIGSNSGHVECIDASSGTPLWLYVFPTINQTMSFSSPTGLPPYYADQARRFREDNRERSRVTGMVPTRCPADAAKAQRGACLDHGRPWSGTVVHDPAPTNPFADLHRLLFLSWASALLPLAGLAILLATIRGRPEAAGTALVVSLLMLVLPALALNLGGRICLWSTLTMKAAFIAVTVFGLWCVVRLLRARRWVESSFALALLGFLWWSCLGALLYA